MRFYFRMYQSLILSLFSLLLSAQECKSKKDILTLQQFTGEVLSHYPALKAQASASRELEAAMQIAESSKKPFAGLSLSSYYTNDPVTVFGTLLKQERFTESDFAVKKLNHPDGEQNFQLGVQAEWVFFNAFQTLKTIRMTKDMFQSSKNSEEALIQEARFLACELAVRYLLSRKISALTENVMNQSLQDIRQAQDLKERGLILGADFFAAKSIVSSLEQMLITSKSHTDQLKMTMNISRGISWDSPFDFSSKMPTPQNDKTSLEEWIQSSRQKHFGLASLRNLILSKETEVQKEKYSGLPRISGFVQAEENTEKFSAFSDNYTVGVKAGMDLFDPSRKHRIKKLEEALNQLRQEEQKLLDQITLLICASFRDHQTLSEQFRVSRSGFKDSEEALKLMEPLYREGKKSIKDLIEIRILSLEDRIRMETYSAEASISYYKLLLSAGVLHDVTFSTREN